MKVVSSLKSHKKRDLNSKLVRRRGRIYIINKKEYIFKKLAKLINPENVLSHADEIKPYETDALAALDLNYQFC